MPHASQNLIQKLREGKAALRLARRNASLEEKLQQLVRAQRMYLEILASRRALNPWERPWDILSDIRDAIAIRDGNVEPQKVPATTFSVSSSHWVRPLQPWVLKP
jgi:hypothetical protein